MNHAAKIIHEHSFFSGQLLKVRLSRLCRLLIVLVVTTLVSAVAVVYVTYNHRLDFSHLQQLYHQAQKIQIQRGKLLLEQASLATPKRIEALARAKLQMHLPRIKHFCVLHEKHA